MSILPTASSRSRASMEVCPSADIVAVKYWFLLPGLMILTGLGTVHPPATLTDSQYLKLLALARQLLSPIQSLLLSGLTPINSLLCGLFTGAGNFSAMLQVPLSDRADI